MSDNKPNEEETKEEEKIIPSLDQVHELAVEELDKQQDEETEKDDTDTSKDTEESSNDNKEDEKVDEDKPEEEPKAPESAPEVKKEADTVQAEQEVIPKVKIKDSDGKVHEFETADDIPDDFEPASYREFAIGTSKLAQREIAVADDKRKTEEKKAEDERLDGINKIKEGWYKDIATLKTAGTLPKEDDKSQPVVDGVFRLMQEELNAGRSINTFAQAFEIYQFRESKKDDGEKQKKINDEKKNRGAKVFSGGAGNPGPTPNKQGKVFEAPPSGISLEQVHERALSGL